MSFASSKVRLLTAGDLLRAREFTRTRSVAIPGAGAVARGSLVEIVGSRSSGRWALALSALAAATAAGEAAALLDPADQLDPKAAREAGADLARLLWVRDISFEHSLRAAEMIAQAGFAVVVLDLAPACRRRPRDLVWQRLARAARAHQTLLLALSDFPLAGSWASAVVAVTGRRAVWDRAAEPPLLEGLALTLDVRRPSGAASSPLSLPVRK